MARLGFRVVFFFLILLNIITYYGGEARGPFHSLGGAVYRSVNNFADNGATHKRSKRSPTLDDRENCNEGDTPPSTRVNTTQQLAKLREEMAGHTPALQAYIVRMDDEHQSEYTSDHDKRVQFISGFAGSAGTAVITADKAALWTDGRYHLQGEAELDCNWIFMKHGLSGVPTISAWLREELSATNNVGADPKLLSYDKWTEYAEDIAKDNINMVEGKTNLVDTVWNDMGDRPAKPNNELLILDFTFAGEIWQDKVERLRQEMKDESVQALVVTALDEVAWLFNLRGSDVQYNPVFFGYAIVEETTKVSLYLNDHADVHLVRDELRQHLNTAADGSCGPGSGDCVTVKAFGDFWADLTTVAAAVNKVWVSPMSSYAAYSTTGEDKVYLEPSLIRSLKGQKNTVEVEGMRKCYHRDSAALIEFMAMLEKEVKAGNEWTEMSAAKALADIRAEKDHNMGLSFESISAVGANGAIIHYRPLPTTDTPITTREMYLLDSGGQYLDGTTDVTRTFHFGTPNEKEIEAYTRVLMGSIDLATLVWPPNTYGRDLDVAARRPLWEVGLNYLHGTGHGIGAYLQVHEGPGRINIGYRSMAHEERLVTEMFFSDEPGYYEEDEFGVRLETIVMTTKADTKYKFKGDQYLGFEEFTLVPFEPHLIDFDLLSPAQRRWLNNYNQRVLKEVGEDILRATGKTSAYEWVKARTEHIPDTPDYTSGTTQHWLSLQLGLLIAVVTAATVI